MVFKDAANTAGGNSQAAAQFDDVNVALEKAAYKLQLVFLIKTPEEAGHGRQRHHVAPDIDDAVAVPDTVVAGYAEQPPKHRVAEGILHPPLNRLVRRYTLYLRRKANNAIGEAHYVLAHAKFDMPSPYRTLLTSPSGRHPASSSG